MNMLDLYSGLGGASQPFLDHDWNVIRIDNNPLLSEVPNTTMKDILKIDLSHIVNDEDPITLIWASPPCLEFSQGFSSPKSKARREGIPFEADMSLMLKAKEIIDFAKPKYWVIENVVGAIKDFAPALGPPRQILGAFCLWGNFPYLTLPEDFEHTKAMNDKHSANPLRSNYKAVIPYPLADSLRRAIEEQRSILEWV